MGDKKNTGSGIWPDAAGEADLEDKMIPPYEGRTGPGNRNKVSDQLRGVVEDVMHETHGPGRPGATTSPVEERPVRPGEVTNQVPPDPHGVGTSQTRRGEDVRDELGEEPGRRTLGTKGKSERPYGTSDQRFGTGVDPQNVNR